MATSKVRVIQVPQPKATFELIEPERPELEPNQARIKTAIMACSQLRTHHLQFFL